MHAWDEELGIAKEESSTSETLGIKQLEWKTAGIYALVIHGQFSFLFVRLVSQCLGLPLSPLFANNEQ